MEKLDLDGAAVALYTSMDLTVQAGMNSKNYHLCVFLYFIPFQSGLLLLGEK